MLKQQTIRSRVHIEGVGLHTGKRIGVDLFPAPAHHGTTFVRTDVPGHTEIKASVDHVVDTHLATTLAAGVNGSRASVATVEHLLSALSGLGIDNVRVHVDGPEIPILDGSAQPFVEALIAAGIDEQRAAKRFMVVRREVEVREGRAVARVSPGKALEINCLIDFDHPLIPALPFACTLTPDVFRKDIASARTFGFMKDVEQLRAHGLALGGSLDNAIVIDHYRVLNPEGLRYPNEFVRHKILDAIGDLALLGLPVMGRVQLERTGHALNTQLVRAILADASNYDIVTARSVKQGKDRSALVTFEPIEVSY